MKKPALNREQREFLRLQTEGTETMYGANINLIYEWKLFIRSITNLFKKRKKQKHINTK